MLQHTILVCLDIVLHYVALITYYYNIFPCVYIYVDTAVYDNVNVFYLSIIYQEYNTICYNIHNIP